jgi:exopolysaccharide biosynthesis polyprenyl glycosylphosphotransferase
VVAGETAVTGRRRNDKILARLTAQNPAEWTSAYLHRIIAADALCALASGLLALRIRFDGGGPPSRYVILSISLPLIWLGFVALAGGYDTRFIGLGTEEFRKVLNAGVTLIAAVAILAYATKTDIARGYVVIALPCLTVLDMTVRLALRKRLHRLRRMGGCMRRVIAVGYTPPVAYLAAELRRETYHGLTVVAACVAEPGSANNVDGIPLTRGLHNVAQVVEQYGADTVAVLACPEMSGTRLRELAWELEKTGTDLCVASALLDVAGPRTTIRPVVGLPLLHLDHPEFIGARRLIKSAFDRVFACVALLLLSPLLLTVAVMVRLADGGPALFRQTRLGQDGRPFQLYKFRSMVVNAEEQKAALEPQNETTGGGLFKIRKDPRLTPVGAWLRRWSVDELPQLLNVALGEMSMVGPRPWTALPYEAAKYDHFVRRRLAVMPGLTGIWQVNGRANLSWEESIRLDLRYVENWSLVLDLQILWKTAHAVIKRSGAY